METLKKLFKKMSEMFKLFPLTEEELLESKRVSSSRKSKNNETKSNPATGLHMVGSADSMGNSFGSSASDDYHRRNNDYHNHYSSSSSSHTSYDHWNR